MGIKRCCPKVNTTHTWISIHILNELIYLQSGRVQEVDFRVGGVKPNISLLSVQGTNNFVFNLLFLFHPPNLAMEKLTETVFIFSLRLSLDFLADFSRNKSILGVVSSSLRFRDSGLDPRAGLGLDWRLGGCRSWTGWRGWLSSPRRRP